ncbi:uncharacterized protein LOC119315668 [Triticum dicoccoides]|nr:uncharacterized protein LOC119315668 [Triticum dicoccoides]XP_044406170.1 uncharacterized protein LOC123130312 [Triticum aestivum]
MDSSSTSGSGAAVAGPEPTSSRRASYGPVLEDEPPRLRFTVGQYPTRFPLADAPGFISSIGAALARHADADAQVEPLEISLVFRAPHQHYIASLGAYATEHPHAALVTADHVRAWLRFGMARAAGSFVLELPPRPRSTTEESASGAAAEAEKNGVALELPRSAASAIVALTLGDATLALPAPADASFHALAELLLSNARISDQHRLSGLLSSPSFPRLKRLRLEHLAGVGELDLCVGDLEELAIVGVRDLWCLQVSAPRLRALRVTECFRLESSAGELAIAAPALEALTCSSMCRMQGLQFDSGPSVREIGGLPLWTHGHANHAARNEAAISIPKQCTAAHRLNLDLHVPSYMREALVDGMDSGMADCESILVDDIPQLLNITALRVNISTWKGHSYAASLARLIAQCSNLEDLRIEVTRGTEKPACLDRACVCHDEDGWENQQLSLERLVHLNITGFQGLDYEERLAQMILAGTPALKRE